MRIAWAVVSAHRMTECYWRNEEASAICGLLPLYGTDLNGITLHCPDSEFGPWKLDLSGLFTGPGQGSSLSLLIFVDLGLMGVTRPGCGTWGAFYFLFMWCDPFNYRPTIYSQHLCSWVMNGVEIHLFHLVGLLLEVTFAVSFFDPYRFHVLKNIS